MRRWLNRVGLVFLLAGWAWLAVGLYRQLPREWGPAAMRPQLEARERLHGFIGRKPVLLTWRQASGREKAAVCLWDVKTKRAVVREDLVGGLGDWRTRYSPRREFAIVAGRLPDAARTRADSTIVDLATGTWAAMPIVHAEPIFHLEKPFVMYSSSPGSKKLWHNVRAFDLKTGACVFQWLQAVQGRGAVELHAAPCFVGDRVALPVVSGGRDALELWDFANDGPVQRFTGVRVGPDATATPDGRRVAWHDGDSYNVRVFDLDAGRVVFAEKPEPEGSIRRLAQGLRTPVLAKDGRSVLAPMSGRLFDVETGRVLWSADEGEAPVHLWDGRLFETRESWSVQLGTRGRKTDAFAVRDLRDGSLVYRTWRPTLGDWRAEDDDGTGYVFTADGAVHALPPVINWPLIAAGEAALAAPLLLAAAVGLWRSCRRRKPEAPVS